MKRSTESTILGFVYQFNLTIDQILKSKSSETIQIEGLIEDIDIVSSSGVKAIQCKYFESKENYNTSDISKPLLQMLKHYCETKNINIRYILHLYFPNEKARTESLSVEDLTAILRTNNIEYCSKYLAYIYEISDSDIIDLIKKPKKSENEKKRIQSFISSNDLNLKFDKNEFLKQFEIVFGPSLSELEKQITKSFSKEGMLEADVLDLYYPNAINLISKRSIISNQLERQITKDQFMSELLSIKEVLITRWTTELVNYRKALKRKKRELSSNLQMNTRKRTFIIEKSDIDTFDDEVVLFICNFAEKYFSKVKLHKEVPLFLFTGVTQADIQNIEIRLHAKGIIVENGHIGNKFDSTKFIREPKRIFKESWIEFRIRLGILNVETIEIIKNNKPDDLFIVSSSTIDGIDLQDVKIELLNVKNFNELEYLLNIIKELK